MIKFIKYQIKYALPIWFCILFTSILPDNRYSIRIRGFLVSIFLPNKPRNLTLGRDITFLGIDKLFIGNDVYIAKGCWINALGTVIIDNEVMLAPYVIIASTKHTFLDGSIYKGGSEFKQVRVGKGTWLAGHSTVVAGAAIGKGCILAANSVAIKSYPDNSLISGVPASVVKELK
ncbi:acyltransferase [Shewanella sp. SR44-4]|uniref:acyltransferase n=1 Tax=Shewanella sp. SR44-4 TaxID=2760935 RepID=UPI001C71F5F1|nr:acyltransferase [Shewanella sp. SR44-4]